MLILVILINIALQDIEEEAPVYSYKVFTYADFSCFYLPSISQGWKGEVFPSDIPVNCPRKNIAISIGLEMKECDVKPIIYDLSFSIGRDIGGGRKKMSDIYGYHAFSEVKTDVLFLGGSGAVLFPFGSISRNDEKRYCAGFHFLFGVGTQGETSLNVKVLKNDTEVSIYENKGLLGFLGVGASVGGNTPWGRALLNVGATFLSGKSINVYNEPINGTSELDMHALGGYYFGLSFNKTLSHCFDWHYQSSASKN
ncbi:MAG: hypothetical protein WC614_08390 [bacterium]